MTLFLASVFVALTASFVFAVVEATLLSLTPSQIADISSRKPALGAIWQNLRNQIEKPIAVIVLLNTSIITIATSIAGAQADDIFGRWLWAFSVVFAFVMVQFADILPKTIGVRFNKSVALIAGRPLSAIVSSLGIVVAILHWINRPFEGGKSPEQMSTVEEISALAGLARLSKQINAHQESIIKGAGRLSRLSARNVMIPAEQVSFLSTSQSLMDAIIAAHIDSHTRFPVCHEGDKDRVAGYVNFKEMVYALRMNPTDPTLTGITRPLLFALPDEPATRLLERFTTEHIHMAIVRDADGRTLGLITLEDIVEELTGEIEDEFDRLPRSIREIAPGSWICGGGAPMREMAKQTGLPLPDSAETVSAWLTHVIGRIPKAGDVCRQAGAEFTIRRTRRTKVFEVAIVRL